MGKRMPNVEKICKCGKQFLVWASREKRTKFCSKKCLYEDKKGRPAWNKGLKGYMAGKNHHWTGRNMSGENNPRWNGGKSSDGNGYVFLSSGQLLREHRNVIQKLIGRKLKGTEIVHHCDENKSNNNIENLQYFRKQAAHIRLHAFARRNNLLINSLRFKQSWLVMANK